jgi:hypothetical protein
MGRRLAPGCQRHWPTFTARARWLDKFKFDIKTKGILLFRPVHHLEGLIGRCLALWL